MEVIILRGIPGSGKSTWAREWVAEQSRRIIVCRDDIRNMLGDYWVPKREALVTAIEEDSVTRAIERGYSVCIDACHVKPKYIKKWRESVLMFRHEGYDIDFKIIQFNVDKHVAITRDEQRENPVGIEVINRMSNILEQNLDYAQYLV